MNDQFRIPDPETRAKSIANLKAASRLLDLFNLELDEAIALIEKDLRLPPVGYANATSSQTTIWKELHAYPKD
jgi:hypothetical protein